MKEPIQCPFDIFVDTAEQRPFTFRDIFADSDQNYRPIVIQRKFIALGRHPNSLGDYSGSGMVGRCHLERKSVPDIQGTILGWPSGYEEDRDLPGRRERFEKELDNLSKIESAAVVVEGSLGTALATMPAPGKKSAEENAKIFFRSVISYTQRWPRVQWFWADDERLAEIIAFRFLYRFHKKMKLRETIARLAFGE